MSLNNVIVSLAHTIFAKHSKSNVATIFGTNAQNYQTLFNVGIVFKDRGFYGVILKFW